MGTLLTVALLLVGLFVIRLLLKARQMANVVNSVSQTGAKVKMTIQMARSKAGAIAEPGPMTPEKQVYIGYLVALADEFSRVDHHSPMMFRPLVAQEAANIIAQADHESSITLLEVCLVSEGGRQGENMGKIDGKNIADPKGAPPFFVELDKWIARRN